MSWAVKLYIVVNNQTGLAVEDTRLSDRDEEFHYYCGPKEDTTKTWSPWVTTDIDEASCQVDLMLNATGELHSVQCYEIVLQDPIPEITV